jgi:hypothetical protein
VRATTRPCPRCRVRVQRAEGCTQMHCTACHVDYDWASGRELQRWAGDNPHMNAYYAELARAANRRGVALAVVMQEVRERDTCRMPTLGGNEGLPLMDNRTRIYMLLTDGEARQTHAENMAAHHVASAACVVLVRAAALFPAGVRNVEGTEPWQRGTPYKASDHHDLRLVALAMQGSASPRTNLLQLRARYLARERLRARVAALLRVCAPFEESVSAVLRSVLALMPATTTSGRGERPLPPQPVVVAAVVALERLRLQYNTDIAAAAAGTGARYARFLGADWRPTARPLGMPSTDQLLQARSVVLDAYGPRVLAAALAEDEARRAAETAAATAARKTKRATDLSDGEHAGGASPPAKRVRRDGPVH